MKMPFVFLLMVWVVGPGELWSQPRVGTPAELVRTAGIDADTGIAYALIAVERTGVGGGRLIAQCSKLPGGKFKFELLASEPGFTGTVKMAFQAPPKAGRGELFAPALTKLPVTMEFVGYVKEKPVKRQWEYPWGTNGLIRYATPGLRSANMEDVAYYVRYLRSLPTLRLTVPGKGMEEFETGKWQAAVKGEPLCAASGL